MHFSPLKLLAVSLTLYASHLVGEVAFVTDYDNTIYEFDTSDVSVAAVPHSTPTYVDIVTFSPDGATVYFSTGFDGDVYSFPTASPGTQTKLNLGISNPIGVAIDSGGLLGYVATDNGSSSGGALYSFPIGGGSHTLLTATDSTVIQAPLFIAILGDKTFVGDFLNGLVYSVVFTPGHYTATEIQSFGNNNVGGIAISNDGFLYISTGFGSKIYRVPLSNPSATATLVANTPTNADGIALSNDGATLYYTYVFGSNAVYSIPTTGTLPVTSGEITPLSNLNISRGIDIAVRPSPAVAPPTGLSATQKKNDFALVYERFNLLRWNRSPTPGVAGYYVYKNGNRIATLNASTLSYRDNNIQRGVTNTYSVSAFDASGNQSAQTPNVKIN